MEWIALQAAIPRPMEFGIGEVPALIALLAVCLPLWLPVRQWLYGSRSQRSALQLCVVHGAAEPTRRAA
jgi:hypothetical protein